MKTKTYLLTLTAVASSTALFSQPAGSNVELLVQPNFFIAIITGVILALGIQVLLTALSIAAGISSVGDVRKSYIDGHYDMDGRDNWDEPSVKEDPVVKKVSHPGMKLTAALGIWSIITVGLSLFAASYFALKLALVTDPSIAVTLSLVIWASTLMILFYFESRLAKTLIGGLISVATSGLKASADMLTGMFSASPEKKMSSMIEDTIKKIRSEFDGSMDTSGLQDVIKAHTDAVKRNEPDLGSIRQEIQAVLAKSEEAVKESKIAAALANEGAQRVREFESPEDRNNQKSQSAISSALNTAKWVAIQTIIKKGINRFSDGNALSDKLGAKQLSNLLDELEIAYASGESLGEKAREIAHVLSPADREETDVYINNMLDYFKTTPADEMNHDTVLSKVNGPKKGAAGFTEKVKARLSEIDQETIKNKLLENTSLTQEQLDKSVLRATVLLDDIKANYADITVNGPRNAKKKVDEVLADFFGKVDRPELDYDALKEDIHKVMDNPSQGLDVIKSRAERLNSDSVWALLNATVGINKDSKNKIANMIYDGRQTVIDKVDSIQQRANRAIENTKRKAIIKAENTRRIAAAAAWWLVATSILSALAAIGGGLLSI